MNPLEETKVLTGTVGEYRAVSGGAAGKVAQSTAATEPVIGIAQQSGVADGSVSVITQGPTRAIAGDNLDSATAGHYQLMVDAQGRMIPWVAAAGPEFAIAIWRPSTAQPTASAGEQIDIIFNGLTGYRA